MRPSVLMRMYATEDKNLELSYTVNGLMILGCQHHRGPR